MGRIKFLVTFLVLSGLLKNTNCMDMLELIFGPKLHNKTSSHKYGGYNGDLGGKEFPLSDAAYHATLYGFPFEEHEITTQDGYILNLHRIPSNHLNGTDHNEAKRPAVLLHHGVFGASENWMFRGPHKDLCYILSNAGYDVWFSNSRGNYHSRKHISMDPDADPNYWNFSYHEMGYYDLPASVDYILNKTEHTSLYYIGYSMGSTVGYILLSTRPEYNKKIKLMINFAGTGVVAHRLAPHWKILFNSMPSIYDSLKQHKIQELFPRRRLISEFLGTVCQDRSPLQAICLTAIYLAVGVDYEQFNTDFDLTFQVPTISHSLLSRRSYVPYVFKYFPSGTSVNTLLHYHQMFTRGYFGPFDASLGTNASSGKTSERMQEYDLTKITAPVTLHYGDGDVLVTKQDNEALARKLPNLVGIFKVPFHNFNHLDFLWSSDSKRLLYDQVTVLMDKFR